MRVGASNVVSPNPQLPQKRLEDRVSWPHAGHRVIDGREDYSRPTSASSFPPLGASWRLGLLFVLSDFHADFSAPAASHSTQARWSLARPNAARAAEPRRSLSTLFPTPHQSFRAAMARAEAGATEARLGRRGIPRPGARFQPRLCRTLPASGDPDEAGGQPGGRPVRAGSRPDLATRRADARAAIEPRLRVRRVVPRSRGQGDKDERVRRQSGSRVATRAARKRSPRLTKPCDRPVDLSTRRLVPSWNRGSATTFPG